MALKTWRAGEAVSRSSGPFCVWSFSCRRVFPLQVRSLEYAPGSGVVDSNDPQTMSLDLRIMTEEGGAAKGRIIDSDRWMMVRQ
jgi:hypothetical protein